MTDPFVQRILARTQARRNVLGKVGDSNKENSINANEKAALNEFPQNSHHSRQKATDFDKINPKTNEGIESKALRETNNTPSSQSLSSTSLSPHKASDSSLNASSKSLNSSRSQRFQHLAQRSKQLQEWEDDYTYHSVCGGLVSNIENIRFGLHESTTASQNEVNQHELPIVYTPKKEETITTKYYFGEFKTPVKSDINESLKLSGHPLPENSHYIPQNQIGLPLHSSTFNASPCSISTSCNGKINTCLSPSTIQSTHTPIGMLKTVSSSKSVTPKRLLDWDKQLLKSLIDSSNNLQRELEAQGFTPSTSKSKLAYDFRDRSPIKDEPAKVKDPVVKVNSEQFESLSTSKTQSSEGPKIVSYISKSSFENLKSDSKPVSHNANVKERDSSPSKVNDLKSRWEQHIRNASPERQCQRVNSPSPTRKFNQNFPSNGAKRNESPTKGRQVSSEINLKLHEQNCPLSPSKSCQKQLHQNKEVSAVPASYGLNHGSCSRISPHKLPLHGEIVKGETPIVQNSSASVKERAAAFSSILNKNVVEKDPAELSVRDRLSLFEKKKGSVLVPKAPFGQCVSDKALLSSSTKPVTYASRSYEIPSEVKTNEEKPNKTFTRQPIGESTQNEPKPSEVQSVVGVHKRHFETLEDKWKDTDINSKILDERNNEMQMLLSRFRKHSGYSSPQKNAISSRAEESDSEYPESESSICESDDFASQEPTNGALGPPKPPRVGIYRESPTKQFVCPNPPPLTHSLTHSPCKRLNSTEIDESCRNSPTKEYVPKIKPGCLFPSLSDIDSQSEAHESEDEFRDSSFAESVLTCASGESLGTKIQKVAQFANGVPMRHQLSIIEEGSELKRTMGSQYEPMSISTTEELEAIDDALDEAFDDNEEVTPPKRGRCTREDEGSNSVYKTPKIQNNSNGTSGSSENSLTHTISMYRKQKPAEVYVTPVRQITRISDFASPSKDSPVSPSVTISSRIRELQEEEEHQLTVISQASSAISVVTQHPEQHGTMQHVEAEKLLLMATQKRQSALHEIQRLKAEGALGKRNYWNQDEDSSRGSISISNITLPLKQDYFSKLGESSIHNFVVLVKHRDQVITSQLQTTPNCIVEGAITFPNLMALHDLTADFNISLEVYGFRVELLNGPGIKKEHSRLKLTPLKRLQKESKCYSPAISSPGGPYSIRSSSFTLIGFANLNINTLTRNAWTLEKVPFTSPVDGHLLMRVSVTMEGGVKESSFLTMFNDVGGFGAWNRRWCVLSGPFIKYWRYPEDENTKEAIGAVDLRMCTTRKVELVPRDICARQYTFQLNLIKPLRPGDKSDLVHEVKDNTLISKILLSADSKEERILWCNKLNKSLANIRAWDPDALKPEDFHV